VRRAPLRAALCSVSLVAALAARHPLAAQDSGARFAVLPFENAGSYGQDKEVFEGLELGLPALLASALDRHPAAEAVSRGTLLEAMRKQDLGPAQRVDAAAAAQVGGATGARYAVTGSFADFYGKLRVNARLVDARNGAIVKVVSNEDPKLQDRAQLAAIIQAVAERLVAAAGLQPYPSGAAGPLIPADAISAFGRGLLYEGRDDRGKASDFYRRALTAFPGFQEAAAGLERVRGG
jgi:TolB-like protein